MNATRKMHCYYHPNQTSNVTPNWLKLPIDRINKIINSSRVNKIKEILPVVINVWTTRSIRTVLIDCIMDENGMQFSLLPTTVVFVEEELISFSEYL